MSFRKNIQEGSQGPSWALLGARGARNPSVASPPCLITFLISRQMGSCHTHDTIYHFFLFILINKYIKLFSNNVINIITILRFEKKSGRDLKDLMGLLGAPGARNTGVASPPCLITFLISRQMGSCHIHAAQRFLNIYKQNKILKSK